MPALSRHKIIEQAALAETDGQRERAFPLDLFQRAVPVCQTIDG